MAQQGLIRFVTTVWPFVLAGSLVLTGCGGADVRVNMGGAPDLGRAGSSPDLLALPDLTPPADLAGPVVVNQVAGVMVSTLAGSSTAGTQDGTGAAAQFVNPVGVALDGSGTLYVTEYEGSRIRRVTPSGVVTLLTAQANFFRPFAVVLNGSSLVVQTDWDSNGTKSDTSGTLWSVATDTGAASVIVTGLGRPRGLAYLAAGSIVVSDETLDTVSMLNPSSGTMTPMTSPAFNTPIGVATMPDGSFVVADSGNHCLRRVSAGQMTMFAGDGNAGMEDGLALASRFDRPIALATDTAGNVYVSDQGNNHRIRRVSKDGVVETLAGNGVEGFADGSGDQAQFYGQEGIAVLPGGGTIYVADGVNGEGNPFNRVRQISIP